MFDLRKGESVVLCFVTRTPLPSLTRPFVLLENAGNKVEKICELSHITLNKNAVFGDSSALSPGGVRIGEDTPVTR